MFAARQQKLDGPELEGRASGSTWLVPIELLPYWGRVTDKTALAAQCKTAMDQAKTAYAAMGCSF